MATPFKLRNGMLLLSTEAPGGIYNAAQLKKIAQLCEGDAAIVKATEDQRLALFVAPEKAAQVAAALKATGLGIRNYQDGLHQPVNCIGELCGDFQQDAMGLSMELSQELAKLSLSSALKIGINGCARCCVPTHTLDISVIGESTGYRVSLGGKNSQIPEMASFMAEGVPPEALPKMLAKVISIYKELAETGESLQEVMERCGAARFVEALAPYSADAAGAGDSDPFGAPAAVADASNEDLGEPEVLDHEALAEAEPSLEDDPLLAEDPLLESELLDAEPALEPMADAEIPLDDGLGMDVTMDDIAITPDDASAILPDDLAPFPADADADLGDELAGEPLEELEDLGGIEAMDDVSGVETMEDLSGVEAMDDLSGVEAMDDLSGIEPEEIPAAAVASAPPARAAAAPAAAPAFASIGSDDYADLAAAVEVEGDEADAFEAKLVESIAEEESNQPVEDENSADRMAAMQLVESGAGLPSVDAVSANLGVDDSFDNLEIDHHDDEAMAEVVAGFEPEEIGAEEAPVAPAPVRAVSALHVRQNPAPAVAPGAGFEFKGIDLGDGGRLTLTFSSGATVVLDPRTMAPGVTRDFTVGGKKIVITQAAAGFSVDVDGVGFFLPLQAA